MPRKPDLPRYPNRRQGGLPAAPGAAPWLGMRPLPERPAAVEEVEGAGHLELYRLDKGDHVRWLRGSGLALDVDGDTARALAKALQRLVR